MVVAARFPTTNRGPVMPDRKTIRRAQQDKREGKAASTQAGEFVREEIEHIRAGKHGARSTKQAIAIGLSKARRAGVDLDPPKPGATSDETRRTAQRDYQTGHDGVPNRVSRKRSVAATKALKHEGRAAVSKQALSNQAKSAAKNRTPAGRSAAARKAVKTKGAEGRAQAARKAAKTRAEHSR